MQYLTPARIGAELSRIVLGLHNPGKTCSTACQKFFDAGGNAFHIHGEGGETTTRETFGRWISDNDLSEEVFVFLQVAHDNGDDPADFHRSRYSKSKLEAELRNHLRMMQRNTVEAVDFGGDNRAYDVVNMVASMHHLRELGVVKHFGTYNWEADRIAELQQAAGDRGQPGFDFVVTTELCIARPTEPIWPGWTSFDDAMERVVGEHNLS